MKGWNSKYNKFYLIDEGPGRMPEWEERGGEDSEDGEEDSGDEEEFLEFTDLDRPKASRSSQGGRPCEGVG